MTEEERQRLQAQLLRKQQELIDMLRAEGYTVEEPVAQSQQAPSQGGGHSPAMAAQFMPQNGGGAAASSGGGMGVAAPAAIAAAIIANETYQNKSGNRPADFKDQVKEGLTGESLERDVERYFDDDELAQYIGRMGNPKGVYKNMKKSLRPWEWW